MPRLLPSLALALALAACGPPPLTQDRLSPVKMSEIVEGPIGHAQAGDIPRAKREFEALLAGSGPSAEPDLLTAFGIGLFTLGSGSEEEGQRYRRESLPYLERAVAAARWRFGGSHPETALALATYGDALKSIAPGDPPRQVDRLFAEAYQIRIRTLGPGNRETVAALLQLARVSGLPSRTGGDPGRIAEAGKMYEKAIRGLEANRDPYSPTPESIRSELRRIYADNGRSGTAPAP